MAQEKYNGQREYHNEQRKAVLQEYYMNFVLVALEYYSGMDDLWAEHPMYKHEETWREPVMQNYRDNRSQWLLTKCDYYKQLAQIEAVLQQWEVLQPLLRKAAENEEKQYIRERRKRAREEYTKPSDDEVWERLRKRTA